MLARYLKERLAIDSPISLRVNKYFPKVPNFEVKEDGQLDTRSLIGPARIEAKEQLVREKMVAVEETRMLKEAVSECFRREGVNAAEHCRPLVHAYADKLSAPQLGMLHVSLSLLLGVEQLNFRLEFRQAANMFARSSSLFIVALAIAPRLASLVPL